MSNINVNIDAQVAIMKTETADVANTVGMIPTSSSLATTTNSFLTAAATFAMKQSLSKAGRHILPNGIMVSNLPLIPDLSINGGFPPLTNDITITGTVAGAAATFVPAGATFTDATVLTGGSIMLSGAGYVAANDKLSNGALGANITATVAADGSMITYTPTTGTTFTAAAFLTTIKAALFDSTAGGPHAVTATITIASADPVTGITVASYPRTVTINLT